MPATTLFTSQPRSATSPRSVTSSFPFPSVFADSSAGRLKSFFDFFRCHVRSPFFSRVNIRSGGALWNRTSSGATPPDAPAHSIKGAAHGRRPPMRAALCILSVPRRWDSRLSERPGRSSTPMLSTAWQACFGTPRPYGHRQPNANLMHNRISQNRTVTLH